LGVEVSRSHRTVPDTVLVIATATNTGSTTFKGWAMFDFYGDYKASSETFDRWRAIRDSSLATASKPIVRDVYPRLPAFVLIPKVYTGEPLKEITLAPREAYSDTLRLEFWGFDFERWPGYIDVSGELLIGASPDTAGVVRLGKHELRVAIPGP
jgi:hypothetical protein